jgi:hypothetical protein
MPKTYTPLATTTLSSAAASVTFSSISGSYTDLVLVITTIGTSGTLLGDVVLQFNSDTGNNYSGTYLSGTGSSALSARGSNASSMLVDYYAELDTGVSNRIVNIQNYSNTTTNKTVISRANNSARGTDAIVGLWRSTSAITSVLIKMSTANTFAPGSTFTLYGILAA